MSTKRKQLELAIAAGLATEADFQGHEVQEIRDIKAALPRHERLAGRVLAHDPVERTIDLVFNAEVVDRMGDLVLSHPESAKKHGGDGWLLDYWIMAGAPYLYVHSANHPVGRCLSTEVREIEVPGRDSSTGKAWALVGKVKFIADSRVPLSEAAYLLMAEGITGSSVGFLPRKMIWIEDEDERTALGLGRWGDLLPSNEMLEVSFAPVPANQVSVGLPKDGALELAVGDALDRFVTEKKLDASLAADYRRLMPLGPQDAAQRVAAKVAGFFDMAKAWGWDGPDGVTLECASGECRVAGGVQTATAGGPIPPLEFAFNTGGGPTAADAAAKGAPCTCSQKSPGSDLKSADVQALLEPLRHELSCLRTAVAAALKAPGTDTDLGTPSGGAVGDGDKPRSGVPEAGGTCDASDSARAADQTLSFDPSRVDDLVSRLTV